MKKVLIMFVILFSVSISTAYAHPYTAETIPSLTSNSPTGVTEVIVFFSEPVDIDFSHIKVLDSNGNQVDNRDTNYYEDEKSLIVTTPPLEDGIYTASTKVLSKVDGHLVPDAFLFAVGDVVIPDMDIEKPSEIIFLPEAGARFPGLVGQTIILGAVIASLIIWGTQNKQIVREEIDKIQRFHHGKFMSITGIGLTLVFVSNILMLVIQVIRLETSPLDVIETYFGNIWLLRMAITIVLLGLWFGLDRKKLLSKQNQIPILIASLILISTSSMIGHGAASGIEAAFALDYIHNLVAAIWIGGIFYFVFILLPALSELKTDKTRKIKPIVNSKIFNRVCHFLRSCNNNWPDSDVVFGKRRTINYGISLRTAHHIKDYDCSSNDCIRRIFPVQTAKKWRKEHPLWKNKHTQKIKKIPQN